MRQKLLKIGKTTGRILLLITIVFVLLIVGFLLRGFVPTAWLQSRQIGPVTLPAWIVQSHLPAVSPTSAPDIVGGIRIEPGPEQTGTPTPLPLITAQPLNTQTTTDTAPTSAVEISPEMADIRTDLQNLARVIDSTRIMVQTIRQGQPTDKEMITVRMQLNVVDQRMDRLAEKVQAVKTTSPEANVPPEQVQTMLIMMPDVVKMLQNILASPEVTSTQLEQIQALLDKYYGIIEQYGSPTVPRASDGQAVTPLATPTTTASSTATVLPVNTPTPLAGSDTQYSQMDAILDQMEELLRQMEAILQTAP